MDKENLKKEIDQYVNNLRIAQNTFQAYKGLQNLINEYNKEINLMPGFIQLTLLSFQTTFLLETYKLVDYGSDKCIQKLLKACENNENLFEKRIRIEIPIEGKSKGEIYTQEIDIDADIKFIRNEILKYKSLITKLKTIRDKYYAHSDKEYFLNNDLLFKENKITYQEIEDLQKFLLQSLNKISNDLTREIYAIEDGDCIKDLEGVLCFLKENK